MTDKNIRSILSRCVLFILQLIAEVAGSIFVIRFLINDTGLDFLEVNGQNIILCIFIIILFLLECFAVITNMTSIIFDFKQFFKRF